MWLKIKNFKFTKKRIILLVATVLALILIFDAVSAAVITSSIFSNGGSKSFYKYAYGEEGLDFSDENKKWIESNSESVYAENDGKKLHALEIKNKNVSHSYVIACHQYGGSAVSMAQYAMHFYELGFNVLLPDLRGFGENEYKKVSMGWEDRLDIVKWCEYITEKDSSARIILFGVSLGASAVTNAAGEELPDSVRAVVADSCYSDVWAAVKGYIKDKPLLQSFPTVNMASAFGNMKNGWSFKDASTVSKAEDVTLPILFIHGENDEFAPISQSNDIFEVCDSDVVDQVIIEDGTHAKNLETDETTYWSEVDLFILNNIGL